MQILRRLLAALIIFMVVCLTYILIVNPVLTARVFHIPFGWGITPEELVSGKPIAIPEAPIDGRSIPQEALLAALEYGERTRSHALLIYHNGALQLEHYFPGYRAGTRTPTDTLHPSVLAILTGIAIRDGFISSVDEPVAHYLPEWANDERGKITIRQLLQQSSGIGFPAMNFNPIGEFLQVKMGGRLGAAVLGQQPESPPGERFDYNDINPQVLGIIIERATGKRYSRYLSEALWQPIGADNALITLDSNERRLARTFCCLGATARSWLQVGLLHINHGIANGQQVVPEQWMRDIATPSARNPNFGYLTWLGSKHEEQRPYHHKSKLTAYHSEPFVADDVIYFDGFGGQRVYAVPSAGLVIVRTGEIMLKWDDAKLPNLILRALQAQPEAQPEVTPEVTPEAQP